MIRRHDKRLHFRLPSSLWSDVAVVAAFVGTLALMQVIADWLAK